MRETLFDRVNKANKSTSLKEPRKELLVSHNIITGKRVHIPFRNARYICCSTVKETWDNHPEFRYP